MLSAVIARNSTAAAAITLLALGCARLNPDYADGASETDALPSTGDTARLTSSDSAAGTRMAGGMTSAVTGDQPLTTAGETEPTTPLDVPLMCGEPTRDCEGFGPQVCPIGERCRAWGMVGAPQGVGCIPQAPSVAARDLDQACARGCDSDAIGVSGCTLGAACDPFSDTPTCVALCATNGSDDCPPDQVCVTHSTADMSEFGLCRPCNPTFGADDGCPPERMCVLTSEGFACFPEGMGLAGDVCTSLSSCSPGMACTAVEGISDALHCWPVCVPGIDACAGPSVCTPRIGGSGFGVCIPP